MEKKRIAIDIDYILKEQNALASLRGLINNLSLKKYSSSLETKITAYT